MTSCTRRTALVAGLALASAGLTGCGFTPLYGTRSVAGGPDVADALAAISIRPLPDRQGMKLRQVLREQLQPAGLNGAALYDLQVTLSERIEELGIRRDATSSRANLVLVATFALMEGGQPIFSDRTQAVVSYNILDDQFATVASKGDAETRAVRQVGEDIKTRLAVFLHRRLNPEQAAAR